MADALSEELTAFGLELAQVKNQLAELKCLPQHEQHRSQGDVEQYFRFLELPREIRDAIYESCLVVGRVLIKKPACIVIDDMRLDAPSSRPDLQLLLCSKQVYHEAVEIYLSKNLFVLLPGDTHWPWSNERHLLNIPSYGGLGRKHIRRLSIALDLREISLMETMSYITDDIPQQMIDDPDSPPVTNSDTVHGLTMDNLCEDTWPTMFKSISYFTKLELLQINLQNCYCIGACHRLVRQAFKKADSTTRPGAVRSVHTLLHRVRPSVLDFLGTMSDKERVFLVKQCSEEGMEIQFHGIVKINSYNNRITWDMTYRRLDSEQNPEEYKDASEEMKTGVIKYTEAKPSAESSDHDDQSEVDMDVEDVYISEDESVD